MTAAPIWRTRLVASIAAIVAVWWGVAVANGDTFWPMCFTAGLVVFMISRFQPLPLSTLILSATVLGYVIGNRGFAQLSLSPKFPFLPGELALACGGPLLLVQCAWRHELPFRRDTLNAAILVWIIVGSLRIGFDVRVYGFMALRDFALVYYALFFFLGQELGADERGRRFFVTLLTVSCAVLLPIFLLADRFPEFFFNQLSWNGNPVIYFKGDLAGTFLAAGAVLFFLRYDEGRRWWNLAASLILGGAVVMMNNRASVLALAVATAWLAIRGRWKFAVIQTAATVLAVITILLVASVLRIPWERTPVFSAYERVVSMVDPMGQRTYRGSETFNKGDNNLFRAVWWQTVIEETVQENPYTGLGFGHDLAARFVRAYYPENSDEFNVRSPHNVLISIFARMGIVGVAAFLGIVTLISVRTWHSMKSGPATGLWCVIWIILTSACLGVVLEGPMGGVVFWIVLGVANGASNVSANDDPPVAVEGSEKDHAAALPIA
jgi:O-antigen ligase